MVCADEDMRVNRPNAIKAATVIGGHVLAAGVPMVLACGIMLADHVFDVI